MEFSGKSVLGVKLRSLLNSLDRDKDKIGRLKMPGRRIRLLSLDHEINVNVVVDPGKHDEAKDWFDKRECKLSGSKGVFLVQMKVKVLKEVEGAPGLESVELPSELFHPRLNHARLEAGLPNINPESSVPRVKSSKPVSSIKGKRKPFTGEGVVIATIDSGLDWRHGDFRHKNGKTRIDHFAWWGDSDDNSTGDEESALRDRQLEPQFAYKAKDINRALSGSLYIAHRDPRGHGTHCMSIAAGNGRASENSEFRGVAPKARIMALGTSRYSDETVKWGIENFFELAGKRPAVISLSYGGHYGPHDGTSAIENVIKRQSGEGRIVVVAAGNEAEDGIHWRGQIKKGKEIVLPIRIGDDSFQWIEVWIPRCINAKAKVETPDRVRYSHARLDPQKTVFGNISLSQGIEANGDTRIILEIENGRINHIWRLVIIFDDSNGGEKPKTREFHAWCGTDDPTTAAHLFLDNTDKDYTVGIPATVEDAIVVGSYVSNNMVTIERKEIKTEFNVGDISPFSSRGPTRKKIRKPDIVAPGQYITAAMASDSIMAKGDRYRPRRHISGPYLALQGTSMATPFVAGVVALMLQRCNTLTPKDVRDLLTLSARKPENVHPKEFDKKGWHHGFGYGLLNINELFKLLECR